MTSQIYYYSITQTDAEAAGIEVGKSLQKLWVPKHGNFLTKLNILHDIIITVSGNPDMKLDENDSSICMDCIVERIQALSPSVMGESIENDESDVTRDIQWLIRWAFEQQFKSILIKYLDAYPSARKYVGILVNQYSARSSYAHLSIFLIKRYKYDITKDNHLLFERAAMSKNAALCELLLEEFEDCRIPRNVYSAFKSFGTKRFQHVWNVLKEYSDRVL